jgi:hypothetical protein
VTGKPEQRPELHLRESWSLMFLVTKQTGLIYVWGILLMAARWPYEGI